MVRVGHVRIGPDHHPAPSGTGAVLPCRSGAPVLHELDEAYPVDLTERLTRPVVGAVVDDYQLVAVLRGFEGLADPPDLLAKVSGLVVDGEHDRDVAGILRHRSDTVEPVVEAVRHPAEYGRRVMPLERRWRLTWEW